MVILLAVSIAVAACGSSVGAPSGPNMPVVAAPKTASGGPPNAYIEFGRPGRWMAQASSCWTSETSQRCVDSPAPDELQGLPTLHVDRGSRGRIHLGFSPDDVVVSVAKRPARVSGHRILSFVVRNEGVLVVSAGRGGDSASYAVRLRFK